MKSSNDNNQKSNKPMGTYLNAMTLIPLAVIVIALLIYAVITLFGSSEKTIMAPGPTGSTNSIEKPLT